MLGESGFQRIDELAPDRILVAVSGGVDSIVLLHLAAGRYGSDAVHAIHVHHGLSESADGWQRLCEQRCERLGVRLAVERVSVAATGNLEANARAARYEVFERVLDHGEVLLLAHHRDDLIETALQNLFRGDARFGVQGMPAERPLGEGLLIRPLIDVSRREIVDWARQQDLAWVEDPSNEDQTLTRNLLRHTLIPAIESAWPHARNAIAGATRRDAAYRELIDAVGRDDLEAARSGAGVLLALLEALPPARRLLMVRSWIERFGLPQPSVAALGQGLPALMSARSDAAPALAWQGVCLRRYRNHVYLCRQSDGNDIDEVHLAAGGRAPFGDGTIAVTYGGDLAQRDGYVARMRHDGLDMLLRHRRRLKKVLQESGVPPWIRDRLPIIFLGDEVVAVPGLPDWSVPMLVADGHHAGDAPGDAPNGGGRGIEVTFRMPGQPYSD